MSKSQYGKKINKKNRFRFSQEHERRKGGQREKTCPSPRCDLRERKEQIFFFFCFYMLTRLTGNYILLKLDKRFRLKQVKFSG